MRCKHETPHFELVLMRGQQEKKRDQQAATRGKE
jgi:hypothetical protein